MDFQLAAQCRINRERPDPKRSFAMRRDINGVKEGRWKATLTFYKPMLRDQAVATEFQREFLGISLPEQPNKYCFILRSHKIVLEADSSIQLIMEKLQIL